MHLNIFHSCYLASSLHPSSVSRYRETKCRALKMQNISKRRMGEPSNRSTYTAIQRSKTPTQEGKLCLIFTHFWVYCFVYSNYKFRYSTLVGSIFHFTYNRPMCKYGERERKKAIVVVFHRLPFTCLLSVKYNNVDMGKCSRPSIHTRSHENDDICHFLFIHYYSLFQLTDWVISISCYATF